MTFLKHHWFGLILSLFMLAYLLVFVLVLLSPRYDMQKRGFIPCTGAACNGFAGVRFLLAIYELLNSGICIIKSS